MFDFIKDPEAKKVADIITRHYAKKSDVVLRVKSFLQRHERLPLGIGEFGFVTEEGSDYLVWRPSGGSKKGELFYAGPAAGAEGGTPEITYDDIDLTTWTEVDGSPERLTVTASQVTFTGLQRSEGSISVRKDFGAGYFGSADFRHRFKINLSSVDLLSWVFQWYISDDVVTPASNDHYVSCFTYSSTPNLYLRQVDGGTVVADDNVAIGTSIDYYIEIEFDVDTGTYGTLYAKIYSDADFSTLVDTLSITLAAAISGQHMRVVSGVGTSSATHAQTGTFSNLQFANNL